MSMASAKRKRSDASELSIPSDDLAQDFKEYLQDLSGNDRYQITNLTVVAKENTEHAVALSDVLLSHIAKVSPTKKLPALYVLDSIVKNVGTPYTDFLTRNLFKTFMDAYTLVDQQTRKQMENMLKTWKEPVPGSMDQQPVFPVETTRPIENALIRARTVFLEQQKQQGFQPGRSPFPAQHALPPRPITSQTAQPWADTPTPPPQPNQYNPPTTTFYSPPPYQAPQPQPASPMPSMTPSYMSQYHSPTYPQQANPQPFSPPQNQPTVPLQYAAQPAQQSYPTQPPMGNYALTQKSYSLAALLQVSGSFSQQQQQQQQPPQQLAVHPPQEPEQQSNQFHGLEALFKYSKPPGHATVAPAYDRIPTPQPTTATSTPVQAKLFTPPLNRATLVRPPADTSNDVQLTTSSLKIPRPALVEMLYSHRPSQCTTCGRRVPATPEGKARKSRHLDAHFRINIKFSQQESQGGRGVSRSWYVGEVDWINAAEYDDADEPLASTSAPTAAVASAGKSAGVEGGSATAASVGETAQKRSLSDSYIKAPADAAMAKYACPICQDEFNAIWHDDAQEWVWMDAVRIGDKVYHGSCLGDMAKDRGGVGGTKAASTIKSKVESV